MKKHLQAYTVFGLNGYFFKRLCCAMKTETKLGQSLAQYMTEPTGACMERWIAFHLRRWMQESATVDQCNFNGITSSLSGVHGFLIHVLDGGQTSSTNCEHRLLTNCLFE